MEVMALACFPFAVSRFLLIEDFSEGASCNMGGVSRCMRGEVEVGFFVLHILLLPVLSALTSNTWSLQISPLLSHPRNRMRGIRLILLPSSHERWVIHDFGP